MRPTLTPRRLLDISTFIWTVFTACLIALAHPMRTTAIIGAIIFSLGSLALHWLEDRYGSG